MEIILNGDIEPKVHYLLSEYDTQDDIDIPIGIIKAKFEKNCHKKLVECISLHTEANHVKDFDLVESDGLNFHIFDVTLVTDGEEEIRTYTLNIMPIF